MRIVNWICFGLVLLLAMIKGTKSIRLIKLLVPNHKFFGESAVLRCLYDLEKEELYSVKWYKDGNEIFRFIPGDSEIPVIIFNQPGIEILRNSSDRHKVTLRRVTLETAGNYRCEVSGEAPLFNTVSRSSRMEVVVLPTSAPRISNAQPVYHVGDVVRVNCTSARSKPAATLSWYINDEKAPMSQMRPYRTIVHENGLETAIMGLEFEVTRDSFPKDQLRLSLRCLASISTVNRELQTIQTHHQDFSIRHSHGSLQRASSANTLNASLLASFLSSLLRLFI